LENQPQPVPPERCPAPIRQCGHLRAVEPDGAAVRLIEARDQVQLFAFAASLIYCQRDTLSGVNAQAGTAKNGDPFLCRAIGFGQVLDIQHWRF
jgi:hypothetical protein